MADLSPPKCCLRGRERTVRDCYDYNPLQAITGQPLGWYSGDDGEGVAPPPAVHARQHAPSSVDGAS